MSCCPSDILPAFSEEYSRKGVIRSSNTVEFYCAGEPKVNGSAIIVIPDVWGWDSGRTRNIADLLAEIVDYVVVPKLLEPSFEGGTVGDGLPPDFDMSARRDEFYAWLGYFKYDDVVKQKLDPIFAHMNEVNISRVGMLGFCWGGYVIAHCACDHSYNIVCAASPHPSIKAEEGLYGGNLADLAAKIRCPFFLLPAGNDPPDYSPGGKFYDILTENNPSSKTEAFPDMLHGFLSRGNMDEPSGNIRRDVLKATSLLQNFFHEHLGQK